MLIPLRITKPILTKNIGERVVGAIILNIIAIAFNTNKIMINFKFTNLPKSSVVINNSKAIGEKKAVDQPILYVISLRSGSVAKLRAIWIIRAPKTINKRKVPNDNKILFNFKLTSFLL
jgi:hypothetical protein